jgi:branched-chain amino acid transport system ATP-binding protein
MLKVEGLNAGYGDVQILWDVDMEIPGGSISALVGANEVGKTTFLRTLAGAIEPYSGRILYHDADITGRPQTWRARNGIMLIPEGRQLYSGLPVEDNLMMGPTPARTARRFEPTCSGSTRSCPC